MPPKNASTSVTPRERSEAPPRAAAASPESYAATGPDVISAPPSKAHQRVELFAREHARVPTRFPTSRRSRHLRYGHAPFTSARNLQTPLHHRIGLDLHEHLGRHEPGDCHERARRANLPEELPMGPPDRFPVLDA